MSNPFDPKPVDLVTPVVPAEAPFKPVFITPVAHSDYGGPDRKWNDTDWFLDDASAAWLKKKFHAVDIIQWHFFQHGPYYFIELGADGKPVIDPETGKPKRLDIPQNVLVFPDAKGGSVEIPAGFLASYYLRWDQKTAEALVWKNLRDDDVLAMG